MKRKISVFGICIIAFMFLFAVSGIFYLRKNNKMCLHDWQVSPAVNATCKSSGKTVGVACAKCGKVLVEQTEIAALGHDIASLPAVPATCEQDGLTEGSYCIRCHTVFTERTEIAALGHDIAILEAVPATCEQDGLTEGSYCMRCKTLLVEQTEITALGHDIAILEAVPATYTESGLTEGSYCTRCDKVLVEQAEVPILDTLYVAADCNKIEAYEYYNLHLRYVCIPKSVRFVGAYAFGMCPENLVIEVSRQCNVSAWDADWCYGNGDGETPFTVIYVD